MKKGICLFAVLVLFLCGCGNDQYAVEKQYWHAQKQAERIFNNPSATPANELERVVNVFSGFISKHPQSNLAAQSDFTIARLYIVKEEFEKARAHLKAMLDKYQKSAAVSSEAVFLMGNSYEKENKWNSALQQYKKIINDYPTTPRGIDIPIYIAMHYKAKFQPDKMLYTFQEAISHYKGLINKYPDSPLSLNLNSLVAQCYAELKDWPSAINTLNGIVETYKNKVNVSGVMMQMAVIYNRELKDKAKAKEILERIVKNYPKTRAAQTALVLMKGMGEK